MADWDEDGFEELDLFGEGLEELEDEDVENMSEYFEGVLGEIDFG